MKKYFLFFFLIQNLAFSIYNYSYSQSPNWLWARSAGGLGGWNEMGNAIHADANGNVIITGNFDSTITFGGMMIMNADSNQDLDVFTVKYDASGNVLWAKSAGGTGFDYGFAINTDNNNNILVTGSFGSPTIRFDTIVLANSFSSYNIFVAKYGPSGNVLWAKSEGGIGTAAGLGISSDTKGNVLITGYFVGGLTIGSTVLTNAGSFDLFVAKYDSLGNVLWTKRAGGASDDRGLSITTDLNNNVYVTGYYKSLSISFGSTLLSNAGNEDFFITKYDSSGNVLWARRAGGTGNDYGNSISSDINGNVLVTGAFRSATITFGATVLINPFNVGNADFFVVKYDSSGNVLWAKNAGGSGNHGALGSSISTDQSSNVYISGSFGGTITFSSISIIPDPTGTDPMFIVEYDSIGNALCASALASGGIGGGISADHFGNAYITSAFQTNPLIVGNDTLMQNGSETVFTAKFTCGTVGVNAIRDESTEMRVFPNPTEGKFNLKISEFENLKMISVDVYNVYTEKVYSKTNFQINTSSNLQIDLSNFPSGIYFVKVGNTVKKLVKM